MVNHFYFYCVDKDFGPFFLKFGTYFLYNARLCINGHEYVKRQLRKVNAANGRASGDAVLSSLAALLNASVRTTDTVARTGGEEFGILLVQAGGDDAALVTNRIRERIANHRVPHGDGLTVIVSAGVAELYPADDAEALLARAHRAAPGEAVGPQRGAPRRQGMTAPRHPQHAARDPTQNRGRAGVGVGGGASVTLNAFLAPTGVGRRRMAAQGPHATRLL